MNKRQQCNECKQIIALGEIRCSCGWQLPRVEVNIKPDLDCQYQLKGKRCRLPGTMSQSTHANARWHCSYHDHSLGDPKLGEEMFYYIEENYEEILAKRADWRRSLHKN